MHIIPPIGLIRKKGPPPIVLVDAGFAQHTGGSNDVVVTGLSGILAGDIIACAICSSGSVFGVPSAAGFTDIFKVFYTGDSQNGFGSFYKVAAGGETSVTMTANAASSDPKFGVAMVFRNAASLSTDDSGQQTGSASPRSLGSHTESDSTSMSLVFGWLNRQFFTDATISVEPVGYTLAARADGSALGAGTQDRILSAWYRPYANLGAQSSQFSFTPSDSHDTIFSKSHLAI